jgi:hypothetical protein
MHQQVIDPLEYRLQRALEVHVVVPVAAEEGYAKQSIVEFFSLFNDCPLFQTLKPRCKRRFIRQWIDIIIKEVNSDGYVNAVKRWSKLGNLFLHSFRKNRNGFSYEPDERLCESPFFSAIIALNKLQHRDGLFFRTVTWILSCHLFLAKTPLSRPDLEITSEADWIARQASVVELSDIPIRYIEALRVVVSWLYNNGFPSSKGSSGKHGPGSTSVGAKTVPEKELAYKPSRQIREVVRYTSILGDNHPTDDPDVAVLRQVVKDVGSMRPITLEPPSTQHGQQAIKRHMYQAIDSKRVRAGHFVKFADQTRSQRLAVKGSKSSSSDATPVTIDLSAASDLLSVDVVSSVFSGGVLHKLMCSRSWNVKAGKLPVEVQMYAGMGAATTFPVQTLVFTGIAIMATLWEVYKLQFGVDPEPVEAVREYLSSRYIKRDPLLWRYLQNVCVYGDDIILPELACNRVLELLRAFGLKVNVDKSFFGDLAVREACGVFALGGHDITPLRYRVPAFNTTGPADYAIFEAYRNLANHAFCRCYTTLYRACVQTLKGLTLFTSGHDSKKESVRTNGMRASNRPVMIEDTHTTEHHGANFEKLVFAEASLLFEEYRGDGDDYIGIISLRKNLNIVWQRIFGELHETVTSYMATTKSKLDERVEDYHLEQALYKGTFEDVNPKAHGKIPRGIRMQKRIAYRRNAGNNGWAWAPSVS